MSRRPNPQGPLDMSIKRSLPRCIATTRHKEQCRNPKLPTHEFCHIADHRYQVEENQLCTVSQRYDSQLGEAASRRARWQTERTPDRETWTAYMNETARLARIQTQQEHRRMQVYLSNGIRRISEQVRAAEDRMTEENRRTISSVTDSLAQKIEDLSRTKAQADTGAVESLVRAAVDRMTEENRRTISSATDSLAQKIEDLSKSKAQADIGAAESLHERYKVELDAVIEISKAVADLREGQARIKMDLAEKQAAFIDLKSLPHQLEARPDRVIEEKLQQIAARQEVQEAATKEIKRLCLEIQTTLPVARDRNRGEAEMLAQEMRERGRELIKDLGKEAQDSIAAAVEKGRQDVQEAATKEIKRLCLEIQTTLPVTRDRNRGEAEILAQEMREFGRELIKDLGKEAQDSFAAAVEGGRHELRSMIEGAVAEPATLRRQLEQLQAPRNNPASEPHTTSDDDRAKVQMEEMRRTLQQKTYRDIGDHG